MPISTLCLKGLGGVSKRYARDERGSFVPTFGVSILAAMLCAGLALDYSRVSHTRSVLSESLDAATLAAGRDLIEGKKTEAEIRRDFEDFFFANFNHRRHQAGEVRIVDFNADPDKGEVTALAQAELDMTLLGLAGHERVTVNMPSQASFANDAIEIAMTLDVTGSMRGSKIRNLRAAASDAVDILIPRQSKSDKVRIGLVPYAQAVNAGSYAWTATDRRSRDCVTERPGRNAFNDAGYGGRDGPVGSTWHDCPRHEILPLTHDRDDLLREISRFQANGYTAGHIGIAWSYYMLSENWRDLWPRDSKPSRYDENVHKIAIVMTDGLFNTYYDGVSRNYFGTGETIGKSRHAAGQLCADMKTPKAGRDGIVVYTIAFDLDERNYQERQARQMMIDCATPAKHGNSYFFDARNGAELKDAFRQIALSIQKLRLSR